MSGFDISTLPDLNIESEMQVLDAEGVPMEGCFITLGSIDHEAYRTELQKIQKVQLTQAANNRIPTPKELEANAIRLHAVVTRSWRGFRDGDKEWPCNAENAAMLYRRAPYINEQVDRYIKDRANFLSDSPKP
jgi:hypothetical protein